MNLRFGRITEMNLETGMARVTFKEDGIVSPWLSIAVPNTKEAKFSLPMSLDEHVYCIMDQNGEAGVIGGAIYSKNTAPDLVDGSLGVVFPDGSTVAFKDGVLTVEAAGEVNITASPKVTITGDLEVTGKIDATGDITTTAIGPPIHLSTHQHPTAGSGSPSPPTPGT